jgi:hypothetical protein
LATRGAAMVPPNVLRLTSKPALRASRPESTSHGRLVCVEALVGLQKRA